MKNKIISILCIFILISFCFINNSVFAYSASDTALYVDETTLNYCLTHKEYDIETMNYVIFEERTSRQIYFVYFNKEYNIVPYVVFNEENDCFYIYIGSDTNSYDYTVVVSNNYTQKYTNESGKYFVCSSTPLVCSNLNIYNQSTDTYFFRTDGNYEPIVIYPSISNTAEDLATGTFDYILVAPGTFSNIENIDLQIYNITNLEEGNEIYSQNPIFSTTLNSSSRFYKAIVVEDQTEFWFEIPRANLNIDFKNGNTYLYSLILGGSPIQEIQATIGGLTHEDILNNNFDNLQSSITESNKELQESIDKQTDLIKENNETNKNIFEKIGEILSYLNPFSENFFAYKLVELIVDGLKSLFIPADNFFGIYFDELNNWFSERLGFLYYPLELLFDLLDRFLNIDFVEPVINIPDIKEPFTNVTLIKSVSFNFNDLLENETLKNVHDIYFLIVDAVIYIGLACLLYKKYEEVMTK